MIVWGYLGLWSFTTADTERSEQGVYGCLACEGVFLAASVTFESRVELSPHAPITFRLPLSSPQDGEIGVIGTGGCSLDVSRMEKSSHTEDILLSPAPYEHWTIMECLQQPEAIARALAFGGIGDSAALRNLVESRHAQLDSIALQCRRLKKRLYTVRTSFFSLFSCSHLCVFYNRCSIFYDTLVFTLPARCVNNRQVA